MSRIRGRTRPPARFTTGLKIQVFYTIVPATSREFKKSMDAIQDQPKDDQNFLKGWKHGVPTGGRKARDLGVAATCARLCRMGGQELPHQWEWQYAAQGTHVRIYTWGGRPYRRCAGPEKGHEYPRHPTM